MKILALEVSTARGSLAWLDEDGAGLSRDWPNDRKNSGAFFENLADVTKKLGPPDTIIVGLGPGSYALDSIAREYSVIGDARRKSFFFARIRANNLVQGPTLFSESELRSKLDAIEIATPVFTSDSLPQFERAVVRFPSALVLARLAREPQRSFSLPPLEPIYLREPHITMPK